MEQYGSLTQQQDALKVWSETDTSAQIVPYIIYVCENTT